MSSLLQKPLSEDEYTVAAKTFHIDFGVDKSVLILALFAISFMGRVIR